MTKIIQSVNDLKPQQRQQSFALPRLILVANEELVDPKTGKVTHEALIYKDHILVYEGDAPDLKEWTDSMGFTNQLIWMWEEDFHTYQGFHAAIYDAIQKKKPHTIINQIRIEAISWIQSVRDRLMEDMENAKTENRTSQEDTPSEGPRKSSTE